VSASRRSVASCFRLDLFSKLTRSFRDSIEAYKWDEIAASVMVMQGASALDDLAEKVLRIGELDFFFLSLALCLLEASC
jgi:hypothetical protein